MKSFAAVALSVFFLVITNHDQCDAENGLPSSACCCRPICYAPVAVAQPPDCALTAGSAVIDSPIVSAPILNVVSDGNVERCEELPAPIGISSVSSVDQPSELNLMMTAELVDLRKQLEGLELKQSENDAALAEAKQLVGERGQELDKRVAEYVKATQRADQAETALVDARKETQAAVAGNKQLQTAMQKAAEESKAAISKLKTAHEAALAQAKKQNDADSKKLLDESIVARDQAAKQAEAARAAHQAMKAQLDALTKELATTKKQLQAAKKQLAEKKAPKEPAEDPAKDADQPAADDSDADDGSAGDKKPDTDAGEDDSAE